MCKVFQQDPLLLCQDFFSNYGARIGEALYKARQSTNQIIAFHNLRTSCKSLSGHVHILRTLDSILMRSIGDNVL